MASFNPVVDVLRKDHTWNVAQILGFLNQRRIMSPILHHELLPMIWLGEVEGVIERAGLDANGCMTWRAK